MRWSGNFSIRWEMCRRICDCQRALPERIEKITYRIEGNVLYLYADANYALMNSVQEILCRAALTKH